jgi:hypothetical protein
MLDAHGKEPASTLPKKLCHKDSLEERDLCFNSNKATLSQPHATLTAKDSTFELWKDSLQCRPRPNSAKAFIIHVFGANV